MSAKLITLEILPLERIQALPECGDFDGGIYFLWLKDELQYIGKSRQIWSRIAQHSYAGRIPFDRHTCIVLDSGRIIKDAQAFTENLKQVERAYIAGYQPRYNCLRENIGT